jgi:Zn-dependent protease with chaperone function
MFRSRRYRVDNEQVVLVLTILLVLAVIIISSTVTLCASGIFIIVMFALSAYMTRAHHQSLMRDAQALDPHRMPELAAEVEECARKLQPGPVDVFIARKNQMNAYTFGISDPKVLVLYSPMLQVMNADELRFIIGHEMGHVALGHTWLNTVLGGMAGIPAPFGAAVLLYAAFRLWNRMCEFSSDRAGLLACGDLNAAISSMVKLVAPEVRSQLDFDKALAMIDAQDDSMSNRFAELFQTHPMLIRRINKLRDYSRTEEYQYLQAGVNKNVGKAYQAKVAPRPPAVTPERSVDKPEKPEKPPEERWPWLKPEE